MGSLSIGGRHRVAEWYPNGRTPVTPCVPGPGPKRLAGCQGQRGSTVWDHRRRAGGAAALGRILINESWVSGGAPMSALEPTPVANPRIWALQPGAKRGHLVLPNPFAVLQPKCFRELRLQGMQDAKAKPFAQSAIRTDVCTSETVTEAIDVRSAQPRVEAGTPHR